MSIELSLLGQILNLARDPEVEIEAFAERIASSPRLSAEIVRVANSALYGMEGRIQELERALLILGVQTVTGIASSILAGDSMKGAHLGAINGNQLWMHSLETGICAQLIARCLALPLESEAYLAGLLHDLGMLDLHEAEPERYPALLERGARQNLPLADLEAQVLGTTHAERLGEAMRVWGFPDSLREAAAAHHDPERASDSGRTLAALIEAAHAIVEDPVSGWQDAAIEPHEGGALLSDLGLLPEDIADVRRELQERLKEALAVL